MLDIREMSYGPSLIIYDQRAYYYSSHRHHGDGRRTPLKR